MNIQEYLSSGTLELYAAGALTAAEMAEVERLTQLYPEIQAELAEVINTLDGYASMHAVTPPDHLKEKVLRAVRHQNPAGANTPPLPPETAKVIQMPASPNRAASDTFKWLVAASVVLLVVSNALSLYFYNNWKKSEYRLQVAMVSQQQYAQNLQRVQLQLNQNQQALALVSDAATKRVILKGVEKSPEAEVTVFWHNKTKNVYVEVNNLPPAPHGHQYQLWALADGKPIDAGLLSDSTDIADFQKLKDVQQAQAFAITLEPKGGSVNPTLDQMFVMGKI